MPLFPDWLREVTPSYTWNWPYLRYIQSHLDKLTAGEIKRLMLFVPPRHGKSQMVTVRYPVWRIAKTPAMRVIVGAYNQPLASKFSRDARKIAERVALLGDDKRATDEWETPQGGGFRAVGVGAGVTGHGGNLIVIDDPVKSREEANSLTYRDRVWDWYTDDLYTRLEPGGGMVLIMTRWHEDDLAGRILRSEDGPNWTVISLPAEAEENDPLGRKVGEALCPERFDVPELANIRRVLGRSYWALYQQRPQEQEGDMFKRSWFEIVRAIPAMARRVRYWDNAGTENAGNYTVGTLLAEWAGVYYVEDVVRGQWSSDERRRIQRETAGRDHERTHGHTVIWAEEEGGSAGKDVSRDFVKMLVGYSVRTERPTGNKVTRADPFAAQCEIRNVKLLAGAWNELWLDELTSFPNGVYDDQVDSAAGAFSKLVSGSGVSVYR